MEHNNVEIAGLRARAGQRVSGELVIAGGSESIPVTVICGTKPGPTVLVTAGIHCAEYVGIQAAIELCGELEPDTLSGCVVILPLVNRNGFEHRTMSVVYDDGKNLNRIFPGSETGTLGERLAWTITEKIHKHVHYYIDLHGGDGYEQMTPYVYCAGAAAPGVADFAREMAMQTDFPYLVVSPVKSGGSYNHAASMGVPSILLERGGVGVWTREQVEADKKDVRNVLRFLKVLSTPAEPRVHTPVDVGKVIYESSRFTGCWYPQKQVGDIIKEGELLGVVRDYFGNTLQSCHAKQDGILLFQAVSLNVLEGGPMVTYSQLPDTARE